jgi:hypothetical protein
MPDKDHTFWKKKIRWTPALSTFILKQDVSVDQEGGVSIDLGFRQKEFEAIAQHVFKLRGHGVVAT